MQRSREEREEIENKYVKELEEIHEEYQAQAKERDDKHSKEVEELRKAAIEAKRQLKASQLAAQRLTDRITKLESDRPSRREAEANFESFLAQFNDSSLPVPPPAGKSTPPTRTGRPPPLPEKKAEPVKDKPQNGAHAKPVNPKAGVPRRGATSTGKKGKEDDLAKGLSDAVGQKKAGDDEEDITMINEVPPVSDKKKKLPAEEAAVLKEMVNGTKRDETDEFLAAFEREFEDIKKP